MPVVGIISDPTLEATQIASESLNHYGVFACLISEMIRKEFGLNWPDVVLMSFSLQGFGRKLMHSSQHCAPENRPRWWIRGDHNNVQDSILCDALIYLTPEHYDNDQSLFFLRFARRKKRILWRPKNLVALF